MITSSPLNLACKRTSDECPVQLIDTLLHLHGCSHLPVACDAVGIDDELEAAGELVGLEVGGWGVVRHQRLQDCRHLQSGAAA